MKLTKSGRKLGKTKKERFPAALSLSPQSNGQAGLRLDASNGDLPPEMGFTKPKGFDPLKLPWSIKSNSVSEAYSAYLLNRIPGEKRMEWMSELWRVLVVGAKVTMIVPYWTSMRSIQDPLSAWPPLCEQSFLYFNKQFRDTNKEKLVGDCDFEFTAAYTLDQNSGVASKAPEVQSFWTKHYHNVIPDLQVTLTKRTG